MNKLTFWEYFTSSFTNRLLTKTIGKADKAVLLLLEYISEAIFSDRSLWGEALCSEHIQHYVCVFPASSCMHWAGSLSAAAPEQRALQEWWSSAVPPQAPLQIRHLLHSHCWLQQGAMTVLETPSHTPCISIWQTLPSRECWASPGQPPELRHSWAGFHCNITQAPLLNGTPSSGCKHSRSPLKTQKDWLMKKAVVCSMNTLLTAESYMAMNF